MELSIYDEFGKIGDWWKHFCTVVVDTITVNNLGPANLMSIRDGMLGQFNAKFLWESGLVVFDSDGDKLAFLLKWS